MEWFHPWYLDLLERHYVILFVSNKRSSRNEFCVFSIMKSDFYRLIYTVVVHHLFFPQHPKVHNMNQLCQIRWLCMDPAVCSCSACTKMMNRIQIYDAFSEGWEKQLSKGGDKALHALVPWRGEESVMCQAVQACWKKIRCRPSRGACHTTLQQASYPSPSRIGALPLSHSGKCHSRGLWHAATCLRLSQCAYACQPLSSGFQYCLVVFLNKKPHAQIHTWLAWLILWTYWGFKDWWKFSSIVFC